MRFSVECGIPQGLGLLLRSEDASTWHGYHLEEPYALIGTAEDCNVRLSDESIAPFHAYLQIIGGRLFVCDLTERGGILLNDFPVVAEWVSSSEQLQIGQFQVRMEAMNAPEQSQTEDEEDEPQSDVRVLTDEEADTRNELILSMPNVNGRLQRVRSDRDVSLVGRSRACKFRLGSSSVANFHCSLVRTPDSVWVVDLGSRRGTFLNGERVKRAQARGGSRLQVGRCRLDFDVHSELEADSYSEAPSHVGVLIPTRSYSQPTMAGYSEELVRDLVADVASCQQTAFEQARAMLVELVASQERMHSRQLDSLRDQNAQLLDVIRLLAGSRDLETMAAKLPSHIPIAKANFPAPDAQQPPVQPAAKLPPPPPEADPEIHNAWVRGQLHTISENLKKEQERGVKKLLRGLMPGKSDDALR